MFSLDSRCMFKSSSVLRGSYATVHALRFRCNIFACDFIYCTTFFFLFARIFPEIISFYRFPLQRFETHKLHRVHVCLRDFACVRQRVSPCIRSRLPPAFFPALERWHRRPHWPWFIGIRIHMTAINLHPLTTSPAPSFLLSVDVLHSRTISLNVLRFSPHSQTFSSLSMFSPL